MSVLQRSPRRVCIIGGGYFGLFLSDYLAKNNHNVKLFEKEAELMMHASLNNQARVHNGYHYPRSVLTALRSRVSFPRFVDEFPDCIDSDFDQYYLVGRNLSKVTAQQFYLFCRRIGAAITRAPASVTELTNPKLIEACFTTHEFAFDAVKLRETMMKRLELDGVPISCRTEVTRVEKSESGLRVTFQQGENVWQDEFDHVFNCTYSRLNFLNNASAVPLIPLKHEMTEMCLVKMPPELQTMGFTVMCGPFFSVMPYPSVKHGAGTAHSLSHVRYTPHYEWHDDPSEPYVDALKRLSGDERHTAFHCMVKDAARYIPRLADCEYLGSLWEVKTVLPRSEGDDSRPILCRFNYGLPGYHCLMGGKVDNAYDAVEAIHNDLGL